MCVCFCQVLWLLWLGKTGALITEVVNFQSVIKKALKLFVLVQQHARVRFYAL